MSCHSTAILPCRYSSAPLGHTQNTHIFHAFEDCKVNISMLVNPRNAKYFLAPQVISITLSYEAKRDGMLKR